MPVLLRVAVPVAPLSSWVGAGLAEVELDADCPPSVDGEEVLRYGCLRLNTTVCKTNLGALVTGLGLLLMLLGLLLVGLVAVVAAVVVAGLEVVP